MTEDGSSFPTLEKFTAETGIKVDVRGGRVDDNEKFFTSDLQAPLEAGLPTEWDIVVVTDWMVARLARLGWLETIDTSVTPNFMANLAENYKGRSFDPDTKLAAPWQSGMTGLGFDQKKTGPLDSLEVLFTDQFKGKLTYLSEMRDTVGLTAIRLGSKPERADPGAVRCRPGGGGQGRQGRHRPPGHRQLVRRGHGRRRRGPGDGVVRRRRRACSSRTRRQSRTSSGRWPTEGGMLWTDNMVIPKGTPNKAQAERWIDFYYEPGQRGGDRGVRQLRVPGRGRARRMIALDPETRQQPADLPAGGLGRPPAPVPGHHGRGGDGLVRGLHQGHGPLDRPMRRAIHFRAIAPYALLLPGLLWLALFYVYPAVQMFLVVAVDGEHRRRLRADLELGDLPGGHRGVLAVARPLDRVRRAGHDPRVRARVPARLRDRLPGRRLQEPAAVPRHRPVLHELPAADDLLEDHPRRSRARPRAAQGHRPGARGVPAAGDAGRCHRRHHLQLPAVHDPAAVRRAREDRQAAHRGGPGPVRRPVATAGHHRRSGDRWRARARRRGW